MSVKPWALEQQASGISTELDARTSVHYDEIKSQEQEWGRRVGVGGRGKKRTGKALGRGKAYSPAKVF